MDKEEIKEKLKESQEGEGKGQMEKLKKKVLKKVLTKEAFERLGRVRVANPALAAQVEMALVQMARSGRVQDKIDDDKLKKILKSIKDSSDSDVNIRRR